MIRVMDNKIFQEVFDILQSVLPPKWDKVCFFAGYTEGSYTMKYYTYNSGTYVDCFSQKEISRTQLIKGFMSIDKVLSTERKVLDEEHRWTVMTMIVSADGSMKSEFDYDDISENAIQYERDWERKYLN
nr:immunity protein YezG family protein [uncultured Lachnoanaerobaculum sp.]